MSEKSNRKKDKKIEFKLDQISKLSHFENDFTEYGLKKEEINRADVEFQIGLQFSDIDDSISLKIKVTFTHPKNKDFRYFGIESLFKYKVRSLSSYTKDDKKTQYEIPDKLMYTFLNIAISGTRGMLAVLITTPEYKSIFLPLVDPTVLMKTLISKDVK